MVSYPFDHELTTAISKMPASEPEDVVGNRARMKERMAAFPVTDTTGVSVSDRHVPGRDGSPAVPVRVYRPDEGATAAGVYMVHGGGFTLGGLETDHALSVQLARDLHFTVVSVDYRLAPETPYPGPLDDAYAGLSWFAATAPSLGVDPQRIAVDGSSAGGGLSAGLTLLARDRGGPAIAFQYLSMPELDDRLTTSSSVQYTDTPLLNRPSARASWQAYLGRGRPGGDDVSHYAAPARAVDLAGLPATYISVMHIDPLRDEGINYAQALLSAGVTVELHLFPGTFHNSANLAPHAGVSRREESERVAVLRKGLSLSAL